MVRICKQVGSLLLVAILLQWTVAAHSESTNLTCESVLNSTGTASVLSVEPLTSQSYLVRLDKPKTLNDLQPGAAFRLSLQTPAGEVSRILSLANSPTKDFLEFAVNRSNSDFKRALSQLRTGELVNIAPLNMGLPYNDHIPAIMIAGGIGITPLRSMIQSASEASSKNPIHLIYANRSEVPFLEELESLAQENNSFDMTLILSQPDKSWQGHRGRITPSFLKTVFAPLPDFERSLFYVVGSPPMVESVTEQLISLGISSERILSEAFFECQDTGVASTTVQTAETKTASKGPLVCYCHSVREGQIQDAISAGACDYQALQKETKAGTGCGRCEKRVKDYL